MSPENERFLKELVEHGRYPSFDAALDAAVRFARIEYEKDMAALREKVNEGIWQVDAGQARPMDIQKLKRELREHWEAKQKRAEVG